MGVSLLEMLVAIMISSVVITALGGLYQTSMINYNVVRDVRENIYTSTLTSDRITDALRKANQSEIKVHADVPVSGNQAISYNYVASAFQAQTTSWSGIVYSYKEKLYLFENAISTSWDRATGKFVKKSGSFDFNNDYDAASLTTWIQTENNRKMSEVIGYGVASFKASKNFFPNPVSGPMSRATTWSVAYLKAGRG